MVVWDCQGSQNLMLMLVVFRSRRGWRFLALVSSVLLPGDGSMVASSSLYNMLIEFFRSFHALDSEGRIHVWGTSMAI